MQYLREVPATVRAAFETAALRSELKYRGHMTHERALAFIASTYYALAAVACDEAQAGRLDVATLDRLLARIKSGLISEGLDRSPSIAVSQFQAWAEKAILQSSERPVFLQRRLELVRTQPASDAAVPAFNATGWQRSLAEGRRALERSRQVRGSTLPATGPLTNPYDLLVTQDSRGTTEDSAALLVGEPAAKGHQQPESGNRVDDDLSVHRWDDLHVRFTSDHQLQVVIEGVQRQVFTYADLGLEDARGRGTGRPALTWLTLRAFAEHDGLLTARKTSALEKRVQRLRSIFRKRFGLDDDPFPTVKGAGYRTAFKITCSGAYRG